MNGLLARLVRFIRNYRVYQQRKAYDRFVERSASASARIFDSILARTPAEEILQSIREPVSDEIVRILHRIRACGYLSERPIEAPARISVIIPHCNQAAYLDEALAGLAIQTVPPHEVIVVDDLSDNFEAVRQVCDRHRSLPRFRLERVPRKLFSGGARQWGADHAEGDVLLMHDADDVSHPNRLELTRELFRIEPRALQLNVGVFPFRGRHARFFRPFPPHMLRPRLHDTRAILTAMRPVFLEQRFAKRKDGGVIFRPGSYGIPAWTPEVTFGCSAGHVAYRRSLANRLKWLAADDLASQGFTDFEDFEFNFVLLLAGQSAFQLDLPLIDQRLDTTTNTAYCREAISSE